MKLLGKVLFIILISTSVAMGAIPRKAKKDTSKIEAEVNKKFERTWDLYLEGKNSVVRRTCENLIKQYPDFRPAYNRLGQIYEREGKYDEALKNYEIFLEKSKDADVKEDISIAQNNIGLVKSLMNKNDEALEALGKSLAIAKGLKDDLLIAIRHNNIGGIYIKEDQLNFAEFNLTNSINKYKKVEGTKENYSIALSNMGIILLQEGKLDNAKTKFEEAVMEAMKEGKNQQNIAICKNNLAGYYVKIKDYDKALDNYSEALKIEKKLGNKPYEATRLGNIGYVYYLKEDVRNAEKYLKQSININEDLKNRERELALDYVNIALVYKDKGDFKKAYKYIEQAEELQNQVDDQFGKALTYTNRGNIKKEEKKYSEAVSDYSLALGIYKNLAEEKGLTKATRDAYKNQLGLIYTHIGDTYYAQKDPSSALANFKEGAKYKEEVEDYAGTAYCYWWMGHITEMNKTKEDYIKAKELYQKSYEFYNKAGTDYQDKKEQLNQFIKQIDNKIAVEEEIERYQEEQARAKEKKLIEEKDVDTKVYFEGETPPADDDTTPPETLPTDEPPVEDVPPTDLPPTDEPPADDFPPTDEPPADDVPPTDEPPVEDIPPTDEPPVETPPSEGGIDDDDDDLPPLDDDDEPLDDDDDDWDDDDWDDDDWDDDDWDDDDWDDDDWDDDDDDDEPVDENEPDEPAFDDMID